MGDYLLDSLIIEGFRGFKRLEIEKFAAVNLIVGKNSVGKTSLLEAIRLYNQRGNPHLILAMLSARQESLPNNYLEQLSPVETLSFTNDIQNIFYNRPHINHNSNHQLAIRIAPHHQTQLEISIKPLQSDSLELGLDIRFGQKGTQGKLVDFFRDPTQFIGYLHELEPLPTVVWVSSTGISASEIVRYWNAIDLTPLEETIVQALNLVVQGITRFSLRDTLAGKVPIALYNGQRVSLRSLGEGLTKMLELALALANASNGILIVDEIGGGLHYSVQTKMWEFLMTLAKELNVQIFATTHSNDCVKAFEYVSNQLTDVEGQIIRLEKWGENTTADILDEELMGYAFEKRIEVR